MTFRLWHRALSQRTNLLAAPLLVAGQVAEVWAVPLARVNYVVALRAAGRQHAPVAIQKNQAGEAAAVGAQALQRAWHSLDGLDGRLRQGQVVAHAVDVSTLAAEVNLQECDQIRACRAASGGAGQREGNHRLPNLRLTCMSMTMKQVLSGRSCPS